MCLLKLDYAKFGVSDLFFSKVIIEKHLRGWLELFCNVRVKVIHFSILSSQSSTWKVRTQIKLDVTLN